MPDFLCLQAVTKRYGSAAALDDVDIGIARGDFVTLLGPSGSGKSTALMTIAGFVRPDSGRILFEGRDITDVAPERRGFGVVFQGYALFPHMSVAKNIAYPLEVRGEGRAATEAKVRRVLDMVQLRGLEDRRPSTLSGGQQQRVAIARALVYEPPLLLLDEPLSALDRKLRGELQSGLKALHARLGTTFVNVTHDQEEALALSTSVVVLSRGRVMQQASPAEIYDRPVSDFVADFIGNANLIPLEGVAPGEGRLRGMAGGQPVAFAPLHGIDGGRAVVSVRQEVFSLGAAGEGDRNGLTGTLTEATRVGPLVRLVVELPGLGPLKLVLPLAEAAKAVVGQEVTLSWPVAETLHVARA